MKKMMVVYAVMALVLSLGTAFAGDLQAADGTKPYNGVTYFDLGLASRIGSEAAIDNAKSYNGVTYFGQRSPESEAEGSGAGGVKPDSPTKEFYNGVTVFKQGSL